MAGGSGRRCESGDAGCRCLQEGDLGRADLGRVDLAGLCRVLACSGTVYSAARQQGKAMTVGAIQIEREWWVSCEWFVSEWRVIW